MAEQDLSSDQVSGRTDNVVLCQPCAKEKINTVASFYCTQCEEYQCTTCVNIHKKYKFMSGHKVVSVENAEPSQPVLDMKGLDQCAEHSKRFKYFCADHDVLCCGRCDRTNHRHCKQIKEITEEARHTSPNVSEIQKIIYQLDENIKESVATLKETIPTVGKELEPLMDEIEQMKQEVIKKFDEVKIVLAQTMQNVSKEEKEKLKEKASKVEHVVTHVEKIQSVSTSVLKSGTSDQKYILAHIVKKDTPRYETIVVEQTKDIEIPVFSLKRYVRSHKLCLPKITNVLSLFLIAICFQFWREKTTTVTSRCTYVVCVGFEYRVCF